MPHSSQNSNAMTAFLSPPIQSGPEKEVSEQGLRLEFLNQTGSSASVCLLLFIK